MDARQDRNHRAYRKLVRDLVPNIISRHGGTCEIRLMDDEEYQLALRKKVVEEAQEVASASVADLPLEIADLYEVIAALVTLHHLDEGAIRQVQEERARQRGKFEQRIELLWTEDS